MIDGLAMEHALALAGGIPLSARARGMRDAHTVSFDVFDTVLCRTWWAPEDVFLACGEDLRRAGAWTGSALDWKRLRVATELALRRRTGAEEVTLAEIHGAIARHLGWPEQQRDLAAGIEVGVEWAGLRACDAGARLVRSLSAEGRRRVVFVSDTSLDSDFIQAKLLHCGLIELGDAGSLFCSSALLKSKARGSLFRHVVAALAIEPSQLVHIGDNPHSDVRMARRAGASAVLWRRSRPRPIETLLAGRNPDRSLLHSAMAGCARAQRLSSSTADSRSRALQEIGATVAGPVLFGYCFWILAEARRRGIRRLYFLARDGQILSQIAARIAATLDAGVECRYLHASRQACYFPAISDFPGDPFMQRWLRTNLAGRTPRQILARLRLDPQAVRRIDPGLAPLLGDDAAPAADPGALIDALLRSAPVAAWVLDQAARARATLLRYLEQEGVIGTGDRAGVVDVGWHGRLQHSIERALAANGVDGGLTGFYFGLRDRPAGADPQRYLAFSDVGGINDAVLEAFTQADHGPVLAIEEDGDGRCGPRLGAAENPQALEAGIPLLQWAALRYTDQVLANIGGRSSLDDPGLPRVREAVLAVARRFCAHPDPDLAMVLGALAFADDQTHCEFTALAPALTPEQVRHAVRDRGYRGPGRLWPAGAISRSVPDGGVRALLLALLAGRDAALHRVRGLRALVAGPRRA